MGKFSKPTKFRSNSSSRSEGRSNGRSEGRSFNSRPSGERRFGNRDSARSSSGSRGGSRMETFEATCDKCGRRCDLPFKPTGSKPVYCRDCFKDGESSEFDSGRQNNFDRSERSSPKERFESPQQLVTREELDAINKKIDKIMKALNIN